MENHPSIRKRQHHRRNLPIVAEKSLGEGTTGSQELLDFIRLGKRGAAHGENWLRHPPGPDPWSGCRSSEQLVKDGEENFHVRSLPPAWQRGTERNVCAPEIPGVLENSISLCYRLSSTTDIGWGGGGEAKGGRQMEKKWAASLRDQSKKGRDSVLFQAVGRLQ
jgi:hypothetical protein